MARKELGHVELEWICPNCGNRNKGRETTCNGCGGGQPPDVAFIQPGDTTFLEDQAEKPSTEPPDVGSSASLSDGNTDAPATPILPGVDLIAPAAPKPAQAQNEVSPQPRQTRPDVHCPFCGVRNPGDASVCRNCGGDLAGAEARVAGQIVGAYQAGPLPDITCPICGTANPASNLRCAGCGAPLPGQEAVAQPPAAPPPAPRRFPWLWLVLVAVICLVFGFLAIRLTSTHTVAAVTSSRSWTRQVQIQQFGPVSAQAWQEDVPSDARDVSCSDRFHHTSNQPEPKSTEVCGTPYTIDQGDGTGKVVQDCSYQVYQSYCRYTVDDWTDLRIDTLQGEDANPVWPEATLSNQQRMGERSENYVIRFNIDGQIREFNTTDANIYLAAAPGSRWKLIMNGLGGIVDIQPVQ